jgi:hypothetical protein
LSYRVNDPEAGDLGPPRGTGKTAEKGLYVDYPQPGLGLAFDQATIKRYQVG